MANALTPEAKSRLSVLKTTVESFSREVKKLEPDEYEKYKAKRAALIALYGELKSAESWSCPNSNRDKYSYKRGCFNP